MGIALSYKGKRTGTGLGKPWSEEDVAEVLARLAKGELPKEIAAAMAIKPARVYYLLQRLNIRLVKRYQGI